MRVAYCNDWPARILNLVYRNFCPRIIRQKMYNKLNTAGKHPLKIVFVSDLHIGPTTSTRLLETTFRKIADEKPDMLLLGGDYVFLDATAERLTLLQSLVKKVDCSCVFAVLGNHDLWADDRAVVEALRAAGVTVLVNETAAIKLCERVIEIIGLDDPHAGECSGELLSSDNKNAALRVAVCHSPEGLHHLTDIQFDIFLAGHTHGGQVASPWGPLVVPHGHLCRRYSSGFDMHKSRLVFISRGIGTVEFPLRMFAVPDFLVLEVT